MTNSNLNDCFYVIITLVRSMTLKWNLDELFKSDNEFYEEIENTKKLLDDIQKYRETTLDENSLFEILSKKWKIKEKANNVLVYGSLKYYQNVNSEECKKLKSAAEEFNNEVNQALNFVEIKIIDLTRDVVNGFIEKNPKLSTFSHYLDNLFRKEEHIQDDETSSKIKNNLNEINEELKKYNNALSELKYGEVEIDGKIVEITSSNLPPLLSSRNRETRKKVYFAINESLNDNRALFASILDTIFKKRIENSHLEGFDSVLDKVLFDENIDPSIIDSLINTVHGNLSLLHEYYKVKTNPLDIDKPHMYDLDVPLSNDLEIRFTTEEAIEIIRGAFKPLGKEYLKVVDCLLDGHIDAELDENKHDSITFSWHTYSFMNFRGRYIDLKNMIHEIGHIVNYYLSKKELPFIYEDSTVFVGETASIVNEILLNRYLYEHAETDEERIFYLSKEIENYITSVFKQTMYTEYEKILYDYSEGNTFSPEFLSSEFEKLVKEYYGDGIEYEDIKNNSWMRLGKLYRWSYYPYKYATGLIMASVVVDMILNKKTLSSKDYVKFLSLGSSLYSLDLLKTIGIDLSSEDIIKNGFKVMEEDIERLKDLTK